LLHVAGAGCLTRFLTRLRENREQDGCQYRNNRDDYQQLDERKSLSIHVSPSFVSLDLLFRCEHLRTLS